MELDRIAALPNLTSNQRLELAISYYELGLIGRSEHIAEKLILDPEVDLEAAELMDKFKPGWDDFIPKIGPKQLGPYR